MKYLALIPDVSHMKTKLFLEEQVKHNSYKQIT